jgi:septum formation inhibitor-activating ATPase MinD
MTVISLMEELGYSEDKIQFVLNKVTPDLERSKVTLATSAIEQRFKRKAIGIIPMDERKVLFAVNRGTSVVAKDRAVSPAKDIIALADALRDSLVPAGKPQDEPQPQQKSGLFGGLMKSGVKPAPKSGTQRPAK